MTFWALLILILLLAALVAYLGDRVAKWAGKRHYRLFGLRPRQTATLVAVLAGVGIALLSYLGFLLVFQEAREVILQAQAIRAERDQLRRERQVLLEAKAAMEAEASRTLAELNVLREERKDLSRALEQANQVRKRLEEEAKALASQVQALGRERATLEAERQVLARLLAERNQELAWKTAELAEKSEELKALEKRLATLQEAVKRAEAERARFAEERKRLQEDVLRALSRLEETRRERQVLAQEVEALKASLARAREELLKTEERVRNLLVQAEVLQGERGQLAQSLVRLSQGLYLGEVRLLAEEGRETLARVAERRALLQGFRGVELLNAVQGPGLAVLEGAGYQEGRLLVRVRLYPERKVFAAGEVLAARTFRLSTQARNQEALEGLGEAVRQRLLQAGYAPEYATFPSPEELARGLALLQGKRGVVRVGVVASKDLWTTERPLLSFQLLGGPPGPEVPVPTRQIP
ncbi:DUF3084 domain-containing protein [Thermus scotoductus]|uniref:DUF3084 domain-containing protein n=2 Tax=Thermus scotoductus TaxID=37636 RepID=A0A430RB61_THESC|nr:DUF3084 domain-containing protein [Thermus scotoductus]RTG97574.1 hypothetical protein CSW49_02670 [Thermus scotoductus]RTH04612.1 hypothetical protein CSW45_04765 [Thermus scotoductus]RTH16953.1 hypothetical protein CSW42_11710 [Thermus scotoductus]RTI02748.1 hypothetical protein CSW28_01145 [Thermus scotoductus]RTI24828.1 hypothetical protein CSW21_01525 [Thermus scotoductus]